MISSAWDRSRRIATAASVLTVAGVLAGAVILVLGAGVPDAWWPRTGQTFAAATNGSTPPNPCELLRGPAAAYCEHGATATPSAEHPRGADGAVWTLLPAGAAVAALVVWRLRSAAGQRRH